MFASVSNTVEPHKNNLIATVLFFLLDSHFRIWDNTYYDYHKGYDLILVKNLKINLYIQTKPVPGYSYIEKTVLLRLPIA